MTPDEIKQHLQNTTITYPEWQNRVNNGYKGKPYDVNKTEWGKAFAGLDSLNPPQPEPTPQTITGIGLYQLGSSLSRCSHLIDDTYTLIIGDWADAALLSRCRAPETYVYTVSTSGVTPGTEGGFVILDANPYGGTIPNALPPQEYANKCVNYVKAHPGLKGIFLDNCLSTIPGLLDAMKTVSAIFAHNGVKWAANVGGYVAGDSRSDNGQLWKDWAVQVEPYLDRLMLENWQEQSSTGKIRLRGNNWDEHWDDWQGCPGVVSGKFIGVSYGSLSNGVYGRASLLCAPGNITGSVFCYSEQNYIADPYNIAWTKMNPVPQIDPANGTASL